VQRTFATFLKDELFEDVPHALWSFTIPKMLRPDFLYLLGELGPTASETVDELMVPGIDRHGLTPDLLRKHSHRALVPVKLSYQFFSVLLVDNTRSVLHPELPSGSNSNKQRHGGSAFVP
jgi:hypothetical protein